MFVCGSCHKKSGCGRCIVPYSHGPCELCHKTDICYDCKHPGKTDKHGRPLQQPRHPDWREPEVKICEQRCPRCQQLMTLQPDTGQPVCLFCGMGQA
jgi:hypothetical protein